MKKYSKLNIHALQSNQDSFENFWTKEPHRYTPKQKQIVENRLGKDYNKLKYQAWLDCCNELGFDINTNYYLTSPFNISNILKLKGPINQRTVIPMEQKIVDKIMSAPKYKLGVNQYITQRKNVDYQNIVEYYCAMVDGKGVLLSVTSRFADKDDKNLNPLNSISVHILLKGKHAFLISRYDTNPGSHHPNKLQDGKLALTKSWAMGPHEHLYDQKLAVVFPFQHFVGHYDAYQRPKFEHFSEAVNFIKSKYNFQEKYFDNSDKIFTKLPKNNLQDKTKNVKIINEEKSTKTNGDYYEL